MAAKDDAAEDKALGKIIAGKLRAQLQAEPSSCPDMETLSAYYERTLSPAEREACENHLMTCTRCQVFIAELARLSEADERPVIVGEPEIEVVSETGFHFHLAWVTPILAVLVIAGVWYREGIRNYLQAPQETAEEEPAPASAAQRAPKGGEGKAVAAPSAKSAEVAHQAGAEEKKEMAAAAPAANIPESSEAQQPAMSGMTIKGAASPAEGTRGGMATPSERDRLSASAAETRILQIPAGARPAAAEAARKDEVASRVAKQAVNASSAPLTNYTIQGSAPTYQPKWRVGKGGLIQHYDPDRGWVEVPSGVRADLFDVTFATSTIGWIVGHEGTVLRTTDGGSSWIKVSSPDGEDLVRVSAIGNQKAQVITRSGRAFVTNDAGKSWTPIGER